VVIALLAGTTCPVENSRTYNGTLAGRNVCYVVTHFLNDAAKFMAYKGRICRACDAMGLLWDQNWAADVFV